MVTLGNYREEGEARARYEDLVKEGYYRLLSVQTLKPKPVVEPEGLWPPAITVPQTTRAFHKKKAAKWRPFQVQCFAAFQ